MNEIISRRSIEEEEQYDVQQEDQKDEEDENEKEDENKHNRYLIPSSKILETELYAIKNGLDIVGFYHSHPDHSAIPSAYDVEHALPVYSYLIVSVYDSKAVDFTISVLTPDRAKFEKELIKG